VTCGVEQEREKAGYDDPVIPDCAGVPAERFGREWLIKEKDLKRVAVRKTGRPKKK